MKKRQAFEDFGLIIDGSDGSSSLTSLNKDELIEQFRVYGMLLFDGFQVDRGIFKKFTDQFSNDYMDHKGGGSYREVINEDEDGTILSVSYNFSSSTQRTFGLPLHSDRSYTRSQPPVMWFYCVAPASADGETTICDGVNFYQKLSESTKKLFEENRIKYVRHYSEAEWQVLYQTKNLEDVRGYCHADNLNLAVGPDNSITTESVMPAIVKGRWGKADAFVNSILIVLWQEEELRRSQSIVRLEDGSKLPANVTEELKEISENVTRDIAWTPGQFVMIDNTRMMHGRRSFADPKRTIYVRMCRSVDW